VTVHSLISVILEGMRPLPRPLLWLARLLLLAPALLTPGALAAAPGAASPCDNAVNPFEASWVWSYRVTPTDPKTPASAYDLHRTGAGIGSGFTDAYTATGKQSDAKQQTPATTLKFRCAGGAQTNVSVPDFQGVTITKATLQGVTIPAQNNWKPGFGWSYVWTLDGRKGILSGSGKLGSQASIVGREQVTVPAGTFDAWKVEYTFTVKARMGFLPFNKSFSFTQWYAEGTGLVKMQNKESITELLSLKK
jgi:hypothetical protein